MKSLLLVLFLFFSVTTARAAEPTVPVVVELYTSQSCSSCPRADALLTKLAQDPSLITLGCHVTYWDHIGWKDTFSLDECTKRQRAYGAHLENGRVYTPEAIISGRVTAVGYRDDLISSAIRKQRQDKKTRSLAIEKSEDGYIISLPELPAGQQVSYFITVLSYGPEQTVKIGSGENDGEQITYAKPVTKIIKLANSWQGKKETRKILASDFPSDTKGIVATVQMDDGAPVIAAGEYKIN